MKSLVCVVENFCIYNLIKLQAQHHQRGCCNQKDVIQRKAERREMAGHC